MGSFNHKPRLPRLFYSVIIDSYMQENPCHCGGFVRIRWLNRPRKQYEIVNCFHESLNDKKFKRAGWMEIKGYFDASR